MKKLLLFVTLVTFFTSSFAQHQADKWFFGQNAALDFTGGSPVVVNAGTFTIPEGCSSICNVAGTLIFCTDGVTVWDTTHTPMPNGTGLFGDISSSQSGLIVPSPASDYQFYIFTVAADGGENGFRYSLVDMTMNNGLGDVVTKNVAVQDSVTEKLAAVKDASGMGYWIVVHIWGSNAFHAYHLTADGLGPAVVSNVGIVYTTSAIQNTYGQMKFSTCGEKLAVAAGYLNTVEVFDFNVATGVVSDPITIPLTEHVFGVEFAKHSDILYVSRYGELATLLQYKISLPTTAAIIASQIELSYTPSIYALQMGPNGKIYVCKAWSPYLGVINAPDTYGQNCNYVDNGVDLDPTFVGNSTALGLPGFMQSFLNTDIPCDYVGTLETEGQTVVSVYPNPFSSEFVAVFSPSSRPSNLMIYDYLGRLIEKVDDPSGDLTFGKLYSPGIYFMRVNEGNNVQTFKLIKQ